MMHIRRTSTSEIEVVWSDVTSLFLQRVSEEMWKKRNTRFPSHTPTTKEYYLLRSIFEEHYPSASALNTVPTVFSPPPRPMKS